MISKVLFIMEKYCDADIRCGPTNSEHLVVSAIKSTGLVKEAKRFYFDVLCQQLGRERMSELLLEDCSIFRPDLIIYTPLGGSLGEQLNPPIEVIHKIVNDFDIKIYAIIWDAKPDCGLEVNWLPYVNYLGIVGSIAAFHYYKENPRIIVAYSAASPMDFYDKNMERDIDVSFLGSIDPSDIRWPMRSEYTRFLRDNGSNILIAGGQRDNRLSVENYSNILNRSKISLDFCRDGSGMPCLKSRVFEITACGALMLEDEGTDTQKFFKHGEDFVQFGTKEELIELIRYYLAHDDKREAVARSGYEKATKVYNAANMWGYIFESMGFELPQGLIKDANFLLHKERMQCL